MRFADSIASLSVALITMTLTLTRSSALVTPIKWAPLVALVRGVNRGLAACLSMLIGLQHREKFVPDQLAQYLFLLDSGELDKLLVDGPSQPLTRRSKILGLVLNAAGLTLLVLVINRFETSMQG